VVTQKQRFAIFGTRAPACATCLCVRYADTNRIFLGGHHLGVCQLSLGLHDRTGQQLLQGDVHKTYVDVA